MQKFKYEGTTKEGQFVSQVVEAADKYAVYDIARANGHIISGVTPLTGLSLGRFFDVEKINAKLSRVNSEELVTLTRNLSSMIKAGLPLTRAITVIERQSHNPRLRQVMQSINENINKGKQLNEALREHPSVFSDLYVAMVRAGEEGGQLTQSLQTLGTQLERSMTLKKKVRGAMIYPSIVITVMLIIGILMMMFVVPTITDTFTKLNVTLPITTRILIGTSDFMSHHILLVLLSIVGFVASLILIARTKSGKRFFHAFYTRIPVIGKIVKEVNAARTARTLASLFEAGVDVIGAIKITEDVLQNVHYKAIMQEAAERVEKGTALSEVFIAHPKYYPVLVGEMISVGEETGQISTMLTEMANFYENEVDQKTKDLSTIIEPILMVIIGGTVGFFALAMIAPIYSITDSV